MTEVSIILMVGFGLLLFYAFALAPRLGSSGVRPAVTAYSLVLILFFLYFFFPGFIHVVFDDNQFYWASAAGGAESTALTTIVVIAALLVFLISYRVAWRFMRSAPAMQDLPPSGGEYLVCYGLIGAGVLMKLIFISEGGGLDTTIMRSSGGVSDVMNLDPISSSMNSVRTLSGIADAAASWLLATSLARHRSRTRAFLIFMVVITITYSTAGKRLFLIWPLLVLLLSVHFYLRPLRMRIMPFVLLLAFGFGFVSLMARVYLPSSFSGSTINLDAVGWSQGSLFRFYSNSLEFASYELTAHIIQNSDRILSYFGDWVTAVYRTNFEPLLFAIPRAIWPEKPEIFVDYGHAVTASVFGMSLENSRYGIAATIVGVSWGFGGLAGLVISMSLLGWMCGACDNKYLSSARPSVNQLIIYAYLIMIMFHFFRQATIGWLFMIVIIQQYGLIIGLVLIRLARPRPSTTGADLLFTRGNTGSRRRLLPIDVESDQNLSRKGHRTRSNW